MHAFKFTGLSLLHETNDYDATKKFKQLVVSTIKKPSRYHFKLIKMYVASISLETSMGVLRCPTRIVLILFLRQPTENFI